MLRRTARRVGNVVGAGDCTPSIMSRSVAAACSPIEQTGWATVVRSVSAVLLLALPGATCLDPGEELGLPEVVDLPAELRRDPTFHRTGGAVLGGTVPASRCPGRVTSPLRRHDR